MRSGYILKFSRPGLVLPGIIAIFCFSGARAATVEVQGVKASDAGQAAANLPPSLAPYKKYLMGFGTFADAGKQPITVSAGQTGSATVGGYKVEITARKTPAGKSKISITIKQDDNVLGPTVCTMKQGDSRSIQAGAAAAPTIFIFTLQKSD